METFDFIKPGNQILYRISGLSAMVLVMAYLSITGLYIAGGVLPEDTEAQLQQFAKQETAWWIILGLSVLTDFLFLPIAIALYQILKEINRNAILAGTGLLVLFVVLDLAVTWPNYASLLVLSHKYGATISETRQASLIAAANGAAAVLASGLFAVYAILLPSLGILIIGLVMLKGIFKKLTAWLGIVTGLLGLISVIGPFFAPALGKLVIITSVLTTIWIGLAGFQFFKLGK